MSMKERLEGYAPDWMQERERDAVVLKPTEHDRHVRCVEHVRVDGHRICVPDGMTTHEAIAEAKELMGL